MTARDVAGQSSRPIWSTSWGILRVGQRTPGPQSPTLEKEVRSQTRTTRGALWSYGAKGPAETGPWNKTWMMMFTKGLDKRMQDKLIEHGSKPLALEELMTLIQPYVTALIGRAIDALIITCSGQNTS
ncbi:hypothetical protein ACJ73_07877 [Blastomyces percursus]|uniref:Uncharacterized protein n=1 Tax=Blastomyces percursus TaxID=1658174 RepID=A0A1J9PWQ3_9EURO|nr:hypothetical protein ACJ73_07877 [Blastomyces percursus]